MRGCVWTHGAVWVFACLYEHSLLYLFACQVEFFFYNEWTVHQATYVTRRLWTTHRILHSCSPRRLPRSRSRVRRHLIQKNLYERQQRPEFFVYQITFALISFKQNRILIASFHSIRVILVYLRNQNDLLHRPDYSMTARYSAWS